MAKNCCCRCSALWSCFSCFSASSPPPPQDGVGLHDTQTLPSTPHVSIPHDVAASQITSSDAIVPNDNANAAFAIVATEDANAANDNTNAAQDAVKLRDTQTLPSSPHAFIPHGVLAPSQIGSSDAIVPNDNSNAAFAIVATEEALLTGQDPQILSSTHNCTIRASSSAVGEASSSDVPPIVKKDNPRCHEGSSGTSTSTTLQTVSSTLDNILQDAAAIEGDYANVDLDGLLKHISALLEHIKEEGKIRSLPKAVERYLPASKGFFKLKEFLSEATNFLKDIIPGDTKTIVRGLLQNVGTAHLATTGLLVVANILERFEEVSRNRGECLQLLKEMIFLAKVVKQIRERPQFLESMDEEVKEATELIVEGSIKCCSQMASSQFSKFFSTSVNKEALGEVAKQLDAKYKHICIQMGIKIYDVSQCQKANLSRRYPENAVGLQDAVREVIDLLEWGSEQNAVAVMLHGFGGMGKTTLADAVFSLVNVEGCQYSMIQLFENIDSAPKIIELQKLILRDLMGSENIPQIRKYEDGQRELSRVLEDVCSFIYIDNVLGVRELGQLLPDDMSKAKKVRLLVTARDLNVRKACPLKLAPKEYSMRPISSVEAKNLLKMEMFGEMEGILYSYQVNHIINKCGGIPLMLKLVARALRVAKDKQEVDEVLDGLEKLKGEDFGPNRIEPYLFAYDKLPEECKDPFLDICSFFQGWDWNIVANIMGDCELEMLARRALITKHTSGVISVHDVILTLGRRKSQGVRFVFTSGNQFKKLLDQKKEEEIQNIKGIWFSENKDLLSISATILDSMHKSLRLLRLGKLTSIEGECSKIFENLVFFQGASLPFGVRELTELKYLYYQPRNLKLLEIPPSLRHMEFDGTLHSQAFEISSRDLEPFKDLRILRLNRFANLKRLPEQVGELVNDLEELTLSYCKSIEKLPPSISKLQHLRVLRMDYCSSLLQVPKDLGSLNSLQELNFQGCINLTVLPTGLEKLSSLKLLDLSSCGRLLELPRGIEYLTSLANFSFSECASLRSIPESIGRLKSSVFSMDMSCCSSLRELPDMFGEFGNLRELNLSGCASLKKLPKSFTQLKNLVKLNLSNCRALEELCNEFHCLLSLEILDLSGCWMLEELPQYFHLLESLQNLYLSWCTRLQNLTEDFHCLPSLQHLYLCYCQKLEGKWMDNLVTSKTLQIMNIQESDMLVKRWGEIQTEGNQSCSFGVYTGQDLSEEEKKNILQKLLSELDCLLIDKQGRPFHICDVPPNTTSLVMFHSDPDDDFPFPLIEEAINDIQINFGMIYIGRHFNKLPSKVKDRILAYSHEISEVIRWMVVKLLLTLDAEVLKSWLLTLEGYVQPSWLEIYIREEPICFKMDMMEDGNAGKYHCCWKVLSKAEIEEFVLGKCRRYLKLKELKETTQYSNRFMLRELFATGDEESNHIFQKNCTSSQDPTLHPKPFACGVEKLIGKTILLEMRTVNVYDDGRLWSMREMYLRENRRVEVISVPIVEPYTTLDALECFSKEVPWMVFQSPWTRTVKYFLVKECGMEGDDIWYPGIIWLIEPDGKISTCKPYRWWNQWKNMSNIQFLFNHLERVLDEVQKMMFQGKIICLYSGDHSGSMDTLIELRDSIHTIYIPRCESLNTEILKITDNIFKEYYTLGGIELPEHDMKETSLLTLNEATRFWQRLFHLNEEINEIDNSDNHLCEMKRFLHSFLYRDENCSSEEEEEYDNEEQGNSSEEEEEDDNEEQGNSSEEEEDDNEEQGNFSLGFLKKKIPCMIFMDKDEEEDDNEEQGNFSLGFMKKNIPCMIFMDKDGKMVASCKGVIMKSIFKHQKGQTRAKRWMQLLINAINEEGKQTDENYHVPNSIKNISTVTVDQENVDVNFDGLSETTSHLLELEILYQLFEFNKEGWKSSREKASAQLYWPTSRGFSMYKDLLTDGDDANWVKNVISRYREKKKKYGILHTIITSLLNEIGEQHWAAAGLLATAHLLERLKTVSANRKKLQCFVVLLDAMYRWVVSLKQRNERPGLTEKTFHEMESLMTEIVLASMMGCDLINVSNFSLLEAGVF